MGAKTSLMQLKGSGFLRYHAVTEGAAYRGRIRAA
jgi:hypothetical protein